MSLERRARAMQVSWARADRETDDTALVAAQREKTPAAVKAEREALAAKARLTLAAAERRLQKAADDHNLFLTTFDDAGVKECYRRDQSIVPQQAMALTNSKLVLDSASRIAARLAHGDAPDQVQSNDVAFIRRAFLEVLGIASADAEVDACRKALEN